MTAMIAVMEPPKGSSFWGCNLPLQPEWGGSGTLRVLPETRKSYPDAIYRECVSRRKTQED